MPFARKVLWVVDVSSATRETAFAQHATAAGANVVCLRTTSKRLPGAIGRFHALGMRVYAWRWPAVVPTPQSTTHYFAMDEAAFVVSQLIPAGLDGYVADPESDGPGQKNDWNQSHLAGLAQNFCAAIKSAAPANFVFGLTSGCAYPSPNSRPRIPWAQFVAASNVLLPQCYWRFTGPNGVQNINGGTPANAITRGVNAWTPIAAGKPIVPMAGEIDVVSAAQIAAYGARLQQMSLPEAHFYADNASVSASNLAAIRAL